MRLASSGEDSEWAKTSATKSMRFWTCMVTICEFSLCPWYRCRPHRQRRPLLVAFYRIGEYYLWGVSYRIVRELLPRLQALDQPVAPTRGQLDLRTYGVGAQILRELGVTRMKLLGSPRRMPSMTGFGLEVTGFEAAE